MCQPMRWPESLSKLSTTKGMSQLSGPWCHPHGENWPPFHFWNRCTAEHPCIEGEGHCSSDTDCLNPGWSKCGVGTCLNKQYFPMALYPNNSIWFGFSFLDNCCHRVCNKDYNTCGINVVGCLNNEDCADGLYCETGKMSPRICKRRGTFFI